eukprot:SAG31_NODE_285_length_18479_cov_9.871980_13_plen_160_part_00
MFRLLRSQAFVVDNATDQPPPSTEIVQPITFGQLCPTRPSFSSGATAIPVRVVSKQILHGTMVKWFFLWLKISAAGSTERIDTGEEVCTKSTFHATVSRSSNAAPRCYTSHLSPMMAAYKQLAIMQVSAPHGCKCHPRICIRHEHLSWRCALDRADDNC